MSAAPDYSHDPAPPPAEPHDIEIEMALLGALLLNNDAYLKAARIIGPEDFYDPVHRAMFEAAGEAINSGRVWDVRTAKRSMPETVGEITASEYIGRLAGEAASIVAVPSYAEEIATLSGKRRIAEICSEAHRAALNGSKPLELLSTLEDEFAAVRLSLGERGSAPMARHAQAMLETLAAAYRSQSYAGVPWPLPEIDMVMSGPMEAGNLYGFLAASGEGKTAAMLQIGRGAAEKGHPVLFVSYDQSPEQCLRQMDAQALGLVVDDMRKGRLGEAEFDSVVEETQRLVRLPFEIEKIGQGKVSRVIAIARAFVKRKHGDKPCLVMIDHIKRVTPERSGDDAGTRVNLITSALKGMSEDLGCCTLLANQRNSAGLRRQNPEPIDEDLFGGAGAKEDYDAILTLYRPEPWLVQKLKVANEVSLRKDQPSEKEQIEQKIERWRGLAKWSTLKNRFGEPGRTEITKFVPHHTKFVSPSAERQANALELGM